MKQLAFDYGEYEKFYADERVRAALVALDKLAKKLKVKYALIGGLGAYLYVNNPPQDEPDIDLLIYDVPQARRYMRALLKVRGFQGNYEDHEDALFGSFQYEKEIQVDILTSFDENQPKKTNRLKGIDVEPIETLIVEKLIRGNASDVRIALDLLAYTDYNKRFLFELGQEYRLTPTLAKAAAFARKMNLGSVSKADIDAMVEALKDE